MGLVYGKKLYMFLTPIAVPGITSTMLLNIILAWNEAFWTLNLTAVDAAPLTAFIASYSSPEGTVLRKVIRRIHHGDCPYFNYGLV